MPPKLIGITGGIGSGKSIIGRVLEVLDFFVYYADREAKHVVYRPDVKAKIIESFGSQSFDEKGQYNRNFIASVVFENRQRLNTLNDIIHPAVQDDFSQCVDKHKNQTLLFKEAAILFETGNYKKLDHIILVTAPLEDRIKRTIERDQVTRNQVLDRIEKQWDDDKKRELADFEIINNEKQLLLPQIYHILEQL